MQFEVDFCNAGEWVVRWPGPSSLLDGVMRGCRTCELEIRENSNILVDAMRGMIGPRVREGHVYFSRCPPWTCCQPLEGYEISIAFKHNTPQSSDTTSTWRLGGRNPEWFLCLHRTFIFFPHKLEWGFEISLSSLREKLSYIFLTYLRTWILKFVTNTCYNICIYVYVFMDTYLH